MMPRAAFNSIFIMPQKAKFFSKRNSEYKYLAYLKRQNYTLHSKQNSSPYRFCPFHVLSFGKGGPKPSGQIAGKGSCVLAPY